MSLPLSPLDASLMEVIRQQAEPVLLGLGRIGACIVWLPYLSTGTVPSRLIRTCTAALILFGLWRSTGYAPGAIQGQFGLFLAVGREVMLGTVMGLVLAFPIHAVHAFGSIIDYQRGASISSVLDPVHGTEATEMANFLQMVSAMVFLAAGGMLSMLRAIQGSYALVPMGGSWSVNISQTIAYVPQLAGEALRMSLPVIILLLLVECLLGVLSRFAEQMNAFSIALALKSFVAFLGLMVYAMWTLTSDVPAMMGRWSGLELFKSVPGT
jgi:type III secretion protein T